MGSSGEFLEVSRLDGAVCLQQSQGWAGLSVILILNDVITYFPQCDERCPSFHCRLFNEE